MRNMLLACETVARSASACVVDARGGELAYRDLAGGHAEAGLVTMLDGLVREFGIPERLALACGPGSFTGLRIGAVAMRTLAWLENLPVHPVDSLAALAAEHGDGRWWVLMPLKRDTTFHGLFEISGGRLAVLQATAAQADDARPELHPLVRDAIAIGPALAAKPGLAERWCPGIALGSPATLTARGVARLAPQIPAVAWAQVLPAYHQASAPELQRDARLASSTLATPPPVQG